MLKQRLLTALIAIPIVVALVLFAPRGLVGGVFALVLFVGAWEWAAFADGLNAISKWAYVLLVIALVAACGLTLNLSGDAWPVTVTVVGVGWWIVAAAAIVTCNAGHFATDIKHMRAWLVGLCGLLTLVPAWAAVVAIRGMPDGAGRLFFLLVLVWVADSGAYTAGRLWGRHKLAPTISPGKTWEGVAGGLLTAAIVGVIGGLCLHVDLAIFVPICILTAIFSIMGDLTESLFKRRVALKDSGHLFPGHGGILDRIDSLTAAAPVFYLCCWALGI